MKSQYQKLSGMWIGLLLCISLGVEQSFASFGWAPPPPPPECTTSKTHTVITKTVEIPVEIPVYETHCVTPTECPVCRTCPICPAPETCESIKWRCPPPKPTPTYLPPHPPTPCNCGGYKYAEPAGHLPQFNYNKKRAAEVESVLESRTGETVDVAKLTAAESKEDAAASSSSESNSSTSTLSNPVKTETNSNKNEAVVRTYNFRP